MIKSNTEVKLRGGLTARITVTDIKESNKPIGGYITYNGREIYATWYTNGNAHGFSESDFDIVMPEPLRKSRWLNWYAREYTSSGQVEYGSREQADLAAGTCRTHVLEIITENGAPVDVKIHKVTERATQGEG